MYVLIHVINAAYGVANELELGMHQFDVAQAFLQSKLKEDIHLRLAEGYSTAADKVVKLKRSIYSLKQASRTWHALLTKTLKRDGFHQCLTDPC